MVYIVRCTVRTLYTVLALHTKYTNSTHTRRQPDLITRSTSTSLCWRHSIGSTVPIHIVLRQGHAMLISFSLTLHPMRARTQYVTFFPLLLFANRRWTWTSFKYRFHRLERCHQRPHTSTSMCWRHSIGSTVPIHIVLRQGHAMLISFSLTLHPMRARTQYVTFFPLLLFANRRWTWTSFKYRFHRLERCHQRPHTSTSMCWRHSIGSTVPIHIVLRQGHAMLISFSLTLHPMRARTQYVTFFPLLLFANRRWTWTSFKYRFHRLERCHQRPRSHAAA